MAPSKRSTNLITIFIMHFVHSEIIESMKLLGQISTILDKVISVAILNALTIFSVR